MDVVIVEAGRATCRPYRCGPAVPKQNQCSARMIVCAMHAIDRVDVVVEFAQVMGEPPSVIAISRLRVNENFGGFVMCVCDGRLGGSRPEKSDKSEIGQNFVGSGGVDVALQVDGYSGPFGQLVRPVTLERAPGEILSPPRCAGFQTLRNVGFLMWILMILVVVMILDIFCVFARWALNVFS